MLISPDPMKYITALFCFWMFSIVSYCQEKKFEELQTDNEWSQGSVMMNDGSELKGLVRFDDRLGILGYQNGDVSRSFTPRNIMAFEFIDGITQKQRVYYSVEYDDPKTNAKRPLFFEVLKDFKAFAVLSKVDPIEIKERTSGGGGMAVNGIVAVGPTVHTTTIRQTETVYFMNQDGLLEPYIRVVHKVVDTDILYDTDKTKKKALDRDLMEKYFTAEENAAIKKFCKEHDLDFRVKEDLIKILDFCAELRNNK